METINFIDFMLDKDLLPNKIKSLNSLEEKKELAKKWISTFLNDTVLGRVELISDKSLQFDNTGLPILLSFYRLNIRQQYLCRFVAILLDQACSSVREFEAWVPLNYQHMILTVAIALSKAPVISFSDGQARPTDTSGDITDLKETASKPLKDSPLDMDYILFATKKEHEKPDFLFRLWALRRSCKIIEIDTKDGDLNLHFNTLACTMQKPTNGPVGGMSPEHFCEFLEDLAEYSFKLNEHKAALHFSGVCIAKRANISEACSVNWDRIMAIDKACDQLLNLPKIFPVSQQFAQIKFSGVKESSYTKVEAALSYITDKTDLFDFTPINLTQLINLFQECWDLGLQSIASIYFLHWLTCEKIIQSEIDTKILIRRIPPTILSWIRSKKSADCEFVELLSLLLPVCSEDSSYKASHVKLINELIAILDLACGRDSKTLKTSSEIGDTLQDCYLNAVDNLQKNEPDEIFTNELNNTLKLDGLKNRKIEINLFRGIQAYRQGRFEEATYFLRYIISEKPKQARLPNGDKNQNSVATSSSDLKEAHLCYSTAIQITAYSKIALYLQSFSFKHLLAPNEEDSLIPSKRNGLEPTPSDIERMIQYFYSRKNYNYISGLLHKLCEVFLSSPPSETWLISNFYAHLSHVFGQISNCFQTSVSDLDQSNFGLLMKADLHMLVSLRKDAASLFNNLTSSSDSIKIMKSVLKSFSAINTHQYIYVLCGFMYGLALRGCSLPHLSNIHGFGIFSVVLAHPNFLGDCDTRTVDIVKSLEKTQPEPVKAGKDMLPELLQFLLSSEIKPLGQLSDHLFCLFEACILNNQFELALRYFVEAASLISEDFSSISSLHKVISKRIHFLAIHCVKKIGIPILLANFCQGTEKLNYTSVFKLLRETPASVVGEEYIPFLWDQNILEFLIAFVWKNNPRVQELLTTQINKQTKAPVQGSHNYEYLTRGFYIQLAKTYLPLK